MDFILFLDNCCSIKIDTVAYKRILEHFPKVDVVLNYDFNKYHFEILNLSTLNGAYGYTLFRGCPSD